MSARGPGPPEDERAVRARVAALLEWACVELDLLSSSFRGCSEEDLEAVAAAQGTDRLPAAYHEFLRRAGQGGIGSAVAQIFRGDDVELASILPSDDWVGMRALAQEIAADAGATLDLDGHAVIRVHRLAVFEYVDVAPADPAVWCFDEATGVAVAQDPSFTAWLEQKVRRSIKRRYPLRDARFPG